MAGLPIPDSQRPNSGPGQQTRFHTADDGLSIFEQRVLQKQVLNPTQLPHESTHPLVVVARVNSSRAGQAQSQLQPRVSIAAQQAKATGDPFSRKDALTRYPSAS